MKKIFFHSLMKYIISFVFGIVVLGIKMIIDNSATSLLTYTNGTFIGGFMLICFGGLSVINYFGGFDIFQVMVAKKGENGKKPTLNEFSQMKAEKRKKNKYVFVPYFTVGGFYLLISLILTIVYQNIIIH